MSEAAITRDQRESVVVGIDRLDTLLDLAGKVIIVSSNLEALNRSLEEARDTDSEIIDESRDLAHAANRISSDLHRLVVDVRHVDMKDLFARFRRLARDISRRVGKPLRFEVVGEEVSLDKTISEQIYDPIAHQIRNAIVHGIEGAELRKSRGKDPVGLVRLEVEATEQTTTIRIHDDGNGVDLEAIRRTALERGLASESEISDMGADELYRFLFAPGFSTAKHASDQAGRGVGMDVVRTVLNALDAEWQIDSHEAVGTTFIYRIPNVSAVNICDTLMVRADDSVFAFPIQNIQATLSCQVSDFHQLAGGSRIVSYLGNYIPLVDLSVAFNEKPVSISDDGRACVLVIRHKGEQVALLVDEFLSPKKVVIGELDKVVAVRGLAGAAVLSGRQLGMVVDVQGLMSRIRGREQSEVDTETPEKQADMKVAEATPVAPAASRESADPVEGSVSFEKPGAAFLQELAAMLGQLNRQLLELDERRDRETTDAVFRLTHSIKGNFGMYGVDGPASITHQLETILDGAREGTQPLADETFDVLFDGCAHLEQVVEALSADESLPDADARLVDGLSRLTESHLSSVDPFRSEDIDTAEVRLDATGEFVLSSRRREGAQLCRSRVVFESGDQPNYLIAYLILRRIQRVGDVIGTWPPVDRIEAGACDNALVVLYSPRPGNQDRMERLEEHLRTFFGVTRFDTEAYC